MENILQFDMGKPRQAREVSPETMKRIMRDGIDRIVVKGVPDDELNQLLATLEHLGHRVEYID